MSDLILGAAIGGLVAFLVAIPAVILEVVERGKAGLMFMADIKTLFGRKLDRYETFVLALLLHTMFGTAFGAAYILSVEHHWLFLVHAPFSIASLLLYAVGTWVVIGALIFPLLGMGFFGLKEGKRVWMEMLASQLLIGLGVWGAVQWFQPVFF